MEQRDSTSQNPGSMPETLPPPPTLAVPATRVTANGDGPSSEVAWQSVLWHVLITDVLVGLLVGIVLAAAVGVLSTVLSLGGTKTYTSTTTMLIDDPLALATADNADQVLKLEQLRTKYAGLATTDAIAAPVARSLGVPVGMVLGSVSVDQPTNSLLMTVTAASGDKAFAQRLSQAVADEITSYVRAEDQAYSIPQGFRFTLRTIVPATPATAPAKSGTHAAAVGTGFGVLALVVGFGATQLIRNRDLLA